MSIQLIQQAICYMEEHIYEAINYTDVAKYVSMSNYNFHRMFSFVVGMSASEYVRNRRLTLAAIELQTTNISVLDAAYKYRYETPESFSKAFCRFHGVSPKRAKQKGAKLHLFNPLAIKIILEGGNIMDYRIEKKPEMVLTGYKRRFTGTPAARSEQESAFYVSTRVNQYILKGISRDCDTGYNIISGFDDEGYDFYIASMLDEWSTENLDKVLGAEEAKRFEKIVVPEGLYLICETERTKYPTTVFEELRRKAVSEWLPASDYELADAPEISVHHWFWKPGDAQVNNSRFIELWIPIEKI